MFGVFAFGQSYFAEGPDIGATPPTPGVEHEDKTFIGQEQSLGTVEANLGGAALGC